MAKDISMIINWEIVTFDYYIYSYSLDTGHITIIFKAHYNNGKLG